VTKRLAVKKNLLQLLADADAAASPEVKAREAARAELNRRLDRGAEIIKQEFRSVFRLDGFPDPYPFEMNREEDVDEASVEIHVMTEAGDLRVQMATSISVRPDQARPRFGLVSVGLHRKSTDASVMETFIAANASGEFHIDVATLGDTLARMIPRVALGADAP
jgi:hypothetical protein